MAPTHEPWWNRLLEPETAGQRMLSLLYRGVTAPLWLAYWGIVTLRRWAYRRGLLRAWSPPRPTLAVGNLLAGGTGKTPLVRWMCRELAKEGLRPAVVMRGYGSGRRMPLLLNVGRAVPTGAGGDEATLLAHTLPETPIVVCPNRREGIEALLAERDVDVLVLDDGFQHLSVARDCDVVVIDAGRSHARAQLLPWGILREPLSALCDAHVICATHATPGQALPRWLREAARRHGVEVARARHAPTRPRRLGDGEPLAGSGQEIEWFLVAGVGNPRALRHSLESQGHRLQRCFCFPDHHEYAWSELEAIRRADPSAYWLTTAKDAVRLLPMLEAGGETSRFLAQRTYVVDAEMVVEEGLDLLRQRMLSAVR